MEQQQQQQAQHTTNDSNNKATNGGSFLCRQSSTRWTPTTDQIRILKELYYNNGVRSPSAEQIQRISARLRQYGKIEGKNVFYWFQNHKARERQKKRFTSDHHHHHQTTLTHTTMMQRNTNTITTTSAWKTDHHDLDLDPDHHQEHHLFHTNHIKYSNLPPVVSCGMSSSSSSANVVGVNGHMGNYQYGYGGVTNMDKGFRDCVSDGSVAQNLGWVGSSDPYSSPYGFFDKRSIALEDDDHDYHDGHDHHDQSSPEIETLPLFPMHGEDGGYMMMMKPNFSDAGGHVSSRTSLELSLNSYGHMSPNSL